MIDPHDTLTLPLPLGKDSLTLTLPPHLAEVAPEPPPEAESAALRRAWLDMVTHDHISAAQHLTEAAQRAAIHVQMTRARAAGKMQ